MNPNKAAQQLQRRLDSIESRRVKAIETANKNHAAKLAAIDIRADEAKTEAKSVVSYVVIEALEQLNGTSAASDGPSDEAAAG